MQPIFRCAVGMDVHLTTVSVCVIVAEPDSEPQVQRRPCGAFQRDRRAMADWMAGLAPDGVVRESTGSYWKSPYAALEKVGIQALVVNAKHVKKVPGRQTDTSDAECLAMLARAGRRRGSFIPPESWRNWRPLGRYHNRTTALLAAEKNRWVRVLSAAGIRLSAVVSDPHGVAARALIDGLLDGGTPEPALVYAGRLQAPREEWLAALPGELSEPHLFVARLIRRPIAILETQLADLERQWFDALKPYEAALEWLLTLPGIDRLAAAKRVVEIGLDRAAFGHAGRLAQWAGVCPGNDESAGQRRSGRTLPGNRYVRAILGEIAWAAIRTTRQFKRRYQGWVIRRGTQKALIASAHQVLKTVFVMWSRRVPYQDSTVDYEALSVQRNAPRWLRQLKQYGYLPKAA